METQILIDLIIFTARFKKHQHETEIQIRNKQN